MGALLSTIIPSKVGANDSAMMSVSTAKKRATFAEDLLHIDGTGAVNDLPDSLVEQILIRVYDKTLKNTCTLVCKQWRRIIEDNQFWLQKCRLVGLTLPPIVAEHSCDYRKVYVKKPFGNNLIYNPSGEQDLKHWKLVKNEGDGWKVERPPAGVDVEVKGFPLCFATSYGWCVKRQIIDLKSLGVDQFVMDQLKPMIKFSEWHAGRFDCASDYVLDVFLGYYETALPIPTEDSFPRFIDEDDDEESRLLYYEMVPRTANGQEDTEHIRQLSRRFSGNSMFHYQLFRVLAKCNIKSHVDQWVGRQWEEAHNVFSNYSAGVRQIIFRSSGKDCQFWAGHYGSKMAKASVTLSF